MGSVSLYTTTYEVAALARVGAEGGYVYFVSYFCDTGRENVISFGRAEVTLSAPITRFEDIIGVEERLVDVQGFKSVVVLNYQLVRSSEEAR